MRDYATVLYFYAYDDWHFQVLVECRECAGRMCSGYHYASGVAAVWDGQQWCVPVDTGKPGDAQASDTPVTPPGFLIGRQLIVTNNPTNRMPQ